MRSTSKFVVAGGAVAAVITLGILLGWLGTRSAQTPETPTPQAAPPSVSVSTSTNRSNLFAKRAQPGTATGSNIEAEVSATQTPVVANWEDRIDSLLRANADNSDKAKQMLALYPSLPVAGQVEAVQHIANLLPNEDYASLGRLLVDPKSPAEVIDVLMSDVFNRPNGLKLPWLLEVARTPDHPKVADARRLLEMYLGQDYGANWDVWQVKVQEWLTNNPD